MNGLLHRQSSHLQQSLLPSLRFIELEARVFNEGEEYSFRIFSGKGCRFLRGAPSAILCLCMGFLIMVSWGTSFSVPMHCNKRRVSLGVTIRIQFMAECNFNSLTVKE